MMEKKVFALHALEEIIGARLFLTTISNTAYRARTGNRLKKAEKEGLHRLQKRFVELANDFQASDGETWSKYHAYEMMRNAFLIGLFSELPPEIKKTLREAQAEAAREARVKSVIRRREIILAHYGERLKSKRPSPSQVIKACAAKFKKAGIECPKDRTIRGDVAAILKEMPEI